MNESTKTALAVVAVVVMAAAFWLALLGPKRDKAGELGEQITRVQSEVASEQALAQSSLAAKKDFTKNYAELVQLGKAVPAEAATPSLLVQLNGVSTNAMTDFQGITGAGAAEGGEEPASPEGTSALVPIGATAGPAGLLAMPYQLQFEGGFFQIANFIEGIDSLVETKNGVVDAKGRLITIDGFNLAAGGEGAEGEGEKSSAKLAADFSVNTYVTPPGQGLTAGATLAGPSAETVAEVP
jgi:Tfp pilus assembly protein PilO